MFVKGCAKIVIPHCRPSVLATLVRPTTPTPLPFTCRPAGARAGADVRARTGQHCELGREGDLLQFGSFIETDSECRAGVIPVSTQQNRG